MSDGINIEVLEGVEKGDKIKGEKMSKIELMKEKKKQRDAEKKMKKKSDN